LYRFLDTRHGDNFENLRRLRHMPYSINAEDAMRMFQDCGEGADWHQQVWREAMNDVVRTVDEHPEVDAIIGYSEGAMVGASLLVEEAVQAQKTGRPRRIKVQKQRYFLVI
jgi:predicted esterase